jgi:multiple sugar transport system permease protein
MSSPTTAETDRVAADPVEASSPGALPPQDDAAPPKRRRARSLPWYLMVAPAVGLILWLIVWPFVQSVILGFQKVPVNGAATWVGLRNFTRLFGDGQMWNALWNTIVFTVASVALEIVIAWVLALLLWSTFKRAGSVLRVLFAIPMLISPVVVGILWRVLLDPTYGWIPSILHTGSLSLLGNPSTAMATMIGVEVWQWTPFVFLIIAAGLNSVPEETLEAARMDGAKSWRLFWSIIWPLTLPVTLVAVLFRGLDTLKAFDLPFNLTSGGPGTSTETIALYLYKQAFTYLDKGYASAISLLATVVMAMLAVVVLAFISRAERKL